MGHIKRSSPRPLEDKAERARGLTATMYLTQGSGWSYPPPQLSVASSSDQPPSQSEREGRSSLRAVI